MTREAATAEAVRLAEYHKSNYVVFAFRARSGLDYGVCQEVTWIGNGSIPYRESRVIPTFSTRPLIYVDRTTFSDGVAR